MSVPRYERRSHNGSPGLPGLQVRKADGKTTLFGYAAVFNSFSRDLGGFKEIIRPGAFKRALQESDVTSLWNHDANHVLGRQSNNTLRVSEDERGLYYEVDLPPTQAARDLEVLVERGDIRGSSFGFDVHGEAGQAWREEGPDVVRELRDLDLYDVSPVCFAAYLATEGAKRSFDRWKEIRSVESAAAIAADLDEVRLLIALAEAEGG
ncbi:MAG TPA: HK97 family phage prohead protease [Pirellulales bacterium]